MASDLPEEAARLINSARAFTNLLQPQHLAAGADQMRESLVNDIDRCERALAAAPVTPNRHTFVVPDGHEAVLDSDGRATGETRLAAPVTLGEDAEARLAATDPLSNAARDVLAERRRQAEVEGWTPQDDDNTVDGTLALAAAAYAFASQYPDELREAKGRPNWWPWSADWWKPTDRRRDLVKAGALILAEIERLDRALSGGAS